MTDKQQTAVAWLREQLVIPAPAATTDWLFAKAIEMERKQIEAAYRADTYPCSDADAEQYYNDNYQTEL